MYESSSLPKEVNTRPAQAKLLYYSVLAETLDSIPLNVIILNIIKSNTVSSEFQKIQGSTRPLDLSFCNAQSLIVIYYLTISYPWLSISRKQNVFPLTQKLISYDQTNILESFGVSFVARSSRFHSLFSPQYVLSYGSSVACIEYCSFALFIYCT